MLFASFMVAGLQQSFDVSVFTTSLPSLYCTAGVVTDSAADLDWDLPIDLELFTDEDYSHVVKLSLNVRM